MNNKKKILWISIAFPPKCDPESLQVARYFEEIAESNFSIDVITSSNPTLYMDVDDIPNLDKLANKLYELIPFENRYLNFILRKLFPQSLEYPDAKYWFHLQYKKVRKPDIIYSRSYPLSSTILALKYKKKWPDVPWILHLSDPWAISFKGDSPATNFRERSRKWNVKMEEVCFSLADKISFTSQKTIELYSEHYKHLKDKFILTPNIYDNKSVNKSALKFNKPLTILCTSGFGQKRNPDFFLECIQIFQKQYSEISSSVQFLFTGPITLENKKKFEVISSAEIKHLGVLKYNEMIQLQHSAHILVNIDSDINDPQHSVFFPSKLLEYFAAKRRILAITNDHSFTRQIVASGFGDCVGFNQKTKLVNQFLDYHEKYLNKNIDFFIPKKSIVEHGVKHNAKQLQNEFETLISSSRK